ncbi:MAG TPA: hypothetical protein VM012_02205 [Flavitalea sp.]|nr:hypothetical protein [Flavitalea sp.]
MTSRDTYRAFVIPVFVIILACLNYTRLTGTENIRAIHSVTLITLGMGLGILLMNVITYFRNKSKM